uniref:Integrin subunit alpha 5 n=1 Tax=Neogobius melanostomus TaxID=47308 RepID=A0A8C6UYU1_9GOBI
HPMPVVLPLLLLHFCSSFNLDTEQRVVFSGPPGSYFGYSVEFYGNSCFSFSVLVGAPKANTSQPHVTEGGAIYVCPWNKSNCRIIDFDKQGDRYFYINDELTQVEFKSHQWFGATLRSHGNNILACAPRYYWRTEHDIPFADVTGTCYLSVDSLRSFVEYAPCRTERHGPAGQGYCQGGFSADFTKDGRVVLGGPGSFYWQGQLISATSEEIVKAYYPSYFLLFVSGQKQTGQVQSSYDDSYLGEEMGSYFGYTVALEELGKVYVYLQKGPLRLEPSGTNPVGSQAFSRFGTSLAPLGDLNQDGFNDIAVGCPFGGEDQQGQVFIYNGYEEGLEDTPTQILSGQWASSSFPAGFGFALRSNKDVDQNGYPDLLVGAFGVDRAIQLDNVKLNKKESTRRTLFLDSHQPSLVKNVSLETNGDGVCYESKLFLLNEGGFRDKLSPIYISLNFSLDPQAPVDEHGLRPILGYHTEPLIQQQAHIQLDCGEDNICVPDLKLAVYGDKTIAYLGDENSLTLIFNAVNEGEGGAYEAELYVLLPPDADYSGIARNNEKTHLTCFHVYEAQNDTRHLMCDLGNPMKSGSSIWAGLRFTIPRLKDTYKVVQFELQIQSKNANNSESEVVVYKLEVAALADVLLQGVSLPDKVLFPPPNWRMSQGLREEQDVGPELQHVFELVNIGPSVISQSTLEVRCPLSAQGQGLLYPVELVTQGPLTCSSQHTFNALKLKGTTQLKSSKEHRIQRRDVHPLVENGNLTCSTVECWTLQCTVGQLGRGDSVILSVRSRLWAETFIEVRFMGRQVQREGQRVVAVVLWNKQDSLYFVPVWIIILSVLAGLLLLSLLIYLLYKVIHLLNICQLFLIKNLFKLK